MEIIRTWLAAIVEYVRAREPAVSLPTWAEELRQAQREYSASAKQLSQDLQSMQQMFEAQSRAFEQQADALERLIMQWSDPGKPPS